MTEQNNVLVNNGNGKLNLSSFKNFVNESQAIVTEIQNSQNIEFKQETLSELALQIENQKVVVPSFQRPYVWTKTKIKELLLSIIYNDSIGDLSLWEFKTSQASDLLDFYNQETKVEELRGRKKLGLMDGLQRLTTLLMLIQYHMVNQSNIKAGYLTSILIDIPLLLKHLSNEGHEMLRDEIIVVSSDVADKDFLKQNCIRVVDLFNDRRLESALSKLLEENSDTEINLDNLISVIKENFVNKLLNYKFNIRVYKDLPLFKATTLFKNMNSAGVPVSEVDIARATLRIDGFDFNEKLNNLKDSLYLRYSRMFGNKNKTEFTKIARERVYESCLKQMKENFKSSQFNQTTALEMMNFWDRFEISYLKTIEHYENKFRTYNIGELPSTFLYVVNKLYLENNLEDLTERQVKELNRLLFLLSFSNILSNGTRDTLFIINEAIINIGKIETLGADWSIVDNFEIPEKYKITRNAFLVEMTENGKAKSSKVQMLRLISRMSGIVDFEGQSAYSKLNYYSNNKALNLEYHHLVSQSSHTEGKHNAHIQIVTTSPINKKMTDKAPITAFENLIRDPENNITEFTIKQSLESQGIGEEGFAILMNPENTQEEIISKLSTYKQNKLENLINHELNLINNPDKFWAK